ncbi:MAG: [Desulfovibrio sp.]|nr:[FeFe] hydrogenase H-cluster maturation GTPase HydF [Desulfovibrio sp.]
MSQTPKGLRLHIAFFGRRNVGKSSLINALAGQEVSIVSPTPGTTTDPVEKTLELHPLGPVVLLDTAGLDDEGELGRLRSERSLQILERVDVALLVTEQTSWSSCETRLVELLRQHGTPFAVVRNKMEREALEGTSVQANPAMTFASRQTPHGLHASVPVLDVSARNGLGLDSILTALTRLAPDSALQQPPLLSDLVPENGLIVLVVPLDSGAPKGRIILPQVQAIRDCLDGRKLCMVVTEGELPRALHTLSRDPDLVVCDSQVVHAVNAQTRADIALTTFSILMARCKGDLPALARGCAALTNLKPGDMVRIQEACSHHPQEDDIARVKLPRLLTRLAGGELCISYDAGKEFPRYTSGCKAVIHCGGCVITRSQMLARLRAAHSTGCPMTNYGMAISLAQGVLTRVLSPFPEALRAFLDAQEA